LHRAYVSVLEPLIDHPRWRNLLFIVVAALLLVAML
jgi:hypothetical protein